MIGQIIHNYRFDKLLGEGGMGVVYQATEMTLQRIVAIKILHNHLVNDSVFFDRFKNEAVLLAHLAHPNVTTLFNFFTENNRSFMVMEYVEGDTLEDYLNKDLPSKFIIDAIIAASDGLSHAHERGILHRDIKPSNIMVTRNGTVKLMDFGIAKMKGSTSLTRIGSIIGTLEYLAPELLSGEDPSVQSDLYAMGVVIYELLVGKLPFEANTEAALINNIIHKKPPSLRTLNPEVPKELDQIVSKLLHKKPERRYASALELKEKLQQIDWGDTVVKSKISKDWMGGVQKSFAGAFSSLKGISEKGNTKKGGNVFEKVNSTEGYLIIGGILLTIGVLFFGLRDTSPKDNFSEEIVGEIVSEENSPLSTIESGGRGVISMNDFPSSPREQEPPASRFSTPAPAPREETRTPKVTPKEQDKKSTPPSQVSTPPPAKTDHTEVKNEPDVKKESEVKSEPPKEESTKPVVRTIKKNIYVKNIPIQLELNMDVSSDDPQIKNKKILFSVLYDIVRDGVNIIPAGSVAEGRVLKVKPSTASGKPFLEIQPEYVITAYGNRLRLKTPPFGMSGSSRLDPVVFKRKTRISPNPIIEDQSITVEIKN